MAAMTGNAIREALEPFAKEAEDWRDTIPDHVQMSAFNITLGDLRRARTAYDAIGSEGTVKVRAIEPEGSPVTLAACPIGLFLSGTSLCLKTEYGGKDGRIDAYIVASGEFFWGDQPQTVDTQRAQIVQPVVIAPTLSGEAEAVPVGERVPAYDAIGSGVKARDEAETFVRNYLLERDDACGFLHHDDSDAGEERKESAREIVAALSTHTAAGAGPVEPRRMAEGCCSAVNPCGHQQRDPYSICDVCTRAAGAGSAGEAVAFRKGADTVEDGSDQAIYGIDMLTNEQFTAPWWGNRIEIYGKKGGEKLRDRILAFLTARPVEEPGEVVHASAERSAVEVFAPLPGLVERLTRERDDARRDYAELDKATEAALAESDQNAQGLASDLAGTQAELAETRKRLARVLRPLREDLANACSSETIVRRHHVQCVDAALTALTGDAQEAGE